MFKKYFLSKILCLLFPVFLLLGCEEKTAPPLQPETISRKIVFKNKKTVKEPVALLTAKTDKPVKEIAAKPEQPAAEIMIYNPEGKIDPFASLFKTAKTTAKDEENQKDGEVICISHTPLQKIDLGQLKLAGIIRAPGGNRAMVEEATGRGYVVKKDTFIGINCGRVAQILKDRIIVNEPLLPVDSVDKDFIYDVNGKSFFITEIKGEAFANVNDKKFKANITKINGRAYYIDPQELKLQKPPGE